MIADVVGSYLDSLEEREFDAPFMALLRALNFWDMHLLHGAFEFGKDFIAKGNDGGVPCQFAFQTKAGDLGLSEWNGCRGQIDLLRTNSLAHPAFDLKLPRRVVFVTTGRLVGGAALAAQDYSQYLQKVGEPGFIAWDRETLVELISSSPEIGLSGSSEGTLLSTVGKIDQGDIKDSELEEFSRRWLISRGCPTLYKGALEAAVVANKLRRSSRLDLACYLTLCLIRAAWVSTHGSDPPDSHCVSVANTGRSVFRHYAADLFSRCSEETLDALRLIHNHELPSAHVTYPIRCLRLVELLGMLGLLEFEDGGHAYEKTAKHLSRFFQANPGASHPISDRWAVSLIAPILFLAKAGQTEDIPPILEEVIRWTGTRYDSNSLGLAGPYSSPDEELSYLLGTPLEHVELKRRSECYVSTVVLDLAAVLEMKNVFELARNDFLAVGAMPSVVEVGDTASQYVLDAADLTFEPNMQYEDSWIPQDGWKVAPHHSRGPSNYYLERVGRFWDHLAICSVLRDRHFATTWRRFLQSKTGQD